MMVTTGIQRPEEAGYEEKGCPRQTKGIWNIMATSGIRSGRGPEEIRKKLVVVKRKIKVNQE